MKRNFKFLFFIAAGLILGSCTDVVQVKLDDGAKIYVIDAFINNLRQTQVVSITQGANYFSNQPAPAVSNAVVTLIDQTTNKQYNFAYNSSGNYNYNITNADTIAFVNHQYLLNVIIDGQKYTALATQKRTAVIDSISAIYDPGTSGFGDPRPFYTCFLWARDKVDNNPDYYWIKTSRNDSLFSDPNQLNVAIDGSGGPINDPSVDTLEFTPPAVFLGFNEYQYGDSCSVQIHSISRDAYNFLIQAVTQIQNGGLFATTPENVRTNIVTPVGAPVKAVGWFNMATVVSKGKKVK